jgi:hypothetical protein
MTVGMGLGAIRALNFGCLERNSAMKAKLVSMALVMFALASAQAAEVRSSSYPLGVLFMLKGRTLMAVNANANAHLGLFDTSIDAKDVESFQQACRSITDNQSWVLGLLNDFQSLEAKQAMPNRTQQIDKISQALAVGGEMIGLCKQNARTRAAEMVAKLSDQRAILSEVQESIPGK